MEIHVFGEDGSDVGRIGRTGRGPGEFVRLTAVGLLPDTLWVFDGAQGRTLFYGHDGAPLATIRSDGAWLTAVTSAGALGRQLSAGFDLTREIRVPLVLMTRTGTPLDTVAWVSRKHWRVLLGPLPGGNWTIANQHFSDADITVTAPGSGLFFIVDRADRQRRTMQLSV